MAEKSKENDVMANRRFIEGVFHSVMTDPLETIQSTLLKSVETYNQQYRSPSDRALSLASLINDFKDGKGRNCMHFSASRGDEAIFKYLHESGGNLHSLDSEDNTPFFIATQHSNLPLVKLLVEKLNYNPKLKRKNGVSALHLASSVGNLQMIEYFLEKECLLEDLSDFGTPIDWAVSYNHLDSVKLLVQKGADLLGGSKFNKELPPPLIMAINLQYNEIAVFMIESSYEIVWCKDKSNWSILHVASEVGNTMIIQKIFERVLSQEGEKKLIELCDYTVEGQTALDLAIQYDKWECVCILRVWSSKKHENLESLKKKSEAKAVIKDKDKANELKLIGNKLFEEGKYSEALQKYDEALEYDDENPALYTNKAGCYVKLEDYEKALKSSQVAKKLDPKWLKSYFREGEAYLLMKEYGDAAASFWEGWNLEPSNKVFKDAFDKAVKLGKAQNKKQ